MARGTEVVAVPPKDLKVMALVGAGHLLSHFYILVLPPLFPLLTGALGVGYTALGFALAVLNVTTALTQAPCGFLVDRFGARWILIFGLALFALATALIGVFPSYPALILLMVLAGLGNTVFHPADYAILSASVDTGRMGRAFSIHTFSGYVGFAVAPATVVFLTELFGWRTALVVCGVIGLLVAAFMAVHADALRDESDAAGTRPRADQGAGGTGVDVRLLLSTPIMMSLAFFVMLALAHGGVTSFGVSALEALYRVPLIEANAPVTVYLITSTAGVLAGGWIADRTRRHERAVALYLVLGAATLALVPLLTPPLLIVMGLFAVAGFFAGTIAPARDLMVRAVTPPGSAGKVFGFVTTGFNIGGIITPLIFGAVLDHGAPRLALWLIAALTLLPLFTVLATGRRGRRGAALAGCPDG